MKKTTLLAGAMLLWTIPAFAQTAGTGKSLTAEQFVEVAGVSNLFEIETSKLALQQAEDAKVKTFAQQMIDDHTKATAELKTVAQKAGAKVPTALDAEHKKLLEDLRAQKGGDFDDDYIEAQVDAHEKAVALFGDYAKSGDQAELKAFAAKTLPTLEMHYDHVQKMD